MNQAAAWSAIVARDRRFDGKFVYAARTTGLYCRPSCPARHPLSRNTELFATAEAAEREGYLACSRCRPARHAETVAESCVKGVIHHIESHFDEPVTLRRLAERTGLSANYLQQVFRQIVGVTPKTYSDVRRVEALKLRLKLGESIAGSGYRVGYGSSRAVYAHTRKNIGMTPAAYQRGGALRVRFAFVRSRFGSVLMADTRRGLCAVLPGTRRGPLVQELRREFPRAAFTREAAPPARWIAAVRASEEEDPLVSRLPWAPRCRIFRARVVALLR